MTNNHNHNTNSSNSTNSNPLLTKKSLHLSLSPPLFPDRNDLYNPHRRLHPHFIHDVIPWDLTFTRWLGRSCMSQQPQNYTLLNKVRDNGTFRSIVNALVTLSASGIALMHPNSALFQFVRLTGKKQMTELRYGTHPMQIIHLYEATTTSSCNGFIFLFMEELGDRVCLGCIDW